MTPQTLAIAALKELIGHERMGASIDGVRAKILAGADRMDALADRFKAGHREMTDHEIDEYIAMMILLAGVGVIAQDITEFRMSPT